MMLLYVTQRQLHDGGVCFSLAALVAEIASLSQPLRIGCKNRPDFLAPWAILHPNIVWSKLILGLPEWENDCQADCQAWRSSLVVR